MLTSIIRKSGKNNILWGKFNKTNFNRFPYLIIRECGIPVNTKDKAMNTFCNANW